MDSTAILLGLIVVGALAGLVLGAITTSDAADRVASASIWVAVLALGAAFALDLFAEPEGNALTVFGAVAVIGLLAAGLGIGVSTVHAIRAHRAETAAASEASAAADPRVSR